MRNYNIDKIKFYINLNYDLRTVYYNKYQDIIDYKNFEDIITENIFYITVA